MVVDYRSVDKLMSSLQNTVQSYSTVLTLFGNAKDLNINAIKGMQRSKGDLNVIYALIQFLQDNSSLIQKFIDGSLDLGLANSLVQDSLNIDIKGMALDALYDQLVNTKGSDGKPRYGTAERANSAYKNYTADQLLNLALQDLLADNFTSFAKGSALSNQINVNTLTFYSIFEKYLDVFFDELAIEPLNKDFRKSLANIAGASYNADTNTVTKTAESNKFYDVINWNYSFTETTYNFSAGYIVEQANTLLYTTFATVLTPAAFTALGFKSGGNENLNYNIERLARFILPLCPDELFNGSFYPSQTTPAAFDAMSFEKIASLAFRAVIESAPEILASVIKLIGLPVDDIEIPDDEIVFPAGVEIDTVEKLALYSIQSFAKQVVSYDYTSLVAAATDDTKRMNAFLDIFMDIVVHYADEYLPIDLPESVVKTYKNRGWGWQAFLEEIIDWVLSYTDGILVAGDSIPATSRVRGSLDNISPWEKINIFLNAVVPLQFLNGVSKGSYPCDTEKLVKEALLGNFFDLDFASMLNVVAKNTNSGNLLNQNIASAFLQLIRSFVNSVLPNTISAADTTNFDTLLNKNNLKGIVGRMISSLNDKKMKLLPALLPLAGSLMFDQLGGVRPDNGLVKLDVPQVTYYSATTKVSADFRIVSRFSQADAATLFKIPANKKFVGSLPTDGLVEMGTLVALKSYMAQKGWDTLDLGKVAGNKVYTAKSTSLYNDYAKSDGSGYYFFGTKITGIANANYSKEFFAVGYVKYKVDGKTEVLYTRGQTYAVKNF
jgi:hypothetical protein